LLASTEKIVRIINRGQVYELVYTPVNTPKSALANLQDALVDLYSTSLELLANSSKLFSKNTAAQTLHALLHPGKTEGLGSKLAELETKLGHEIQACEAGRSAAADERLTGLLRRLDAPLTRIDERVGTRLEEVDKKEQIEMLEWISRVHYSAHHDTVKEARTLDTCEWLLRHEKFRQWEEASSPAILWLQGSRKCSVSRVLLLYG
jgi:ankyrin repeat domain-containing protein 50